ncbi:unnamed protein product [Closterium sp. NIES-53]
MASLRVLAFDHEGRPVAFDMWHNDLQLYLLSDIKDSVSLFDHVSGVAPAPLATADGVTLSQWLCRDATACLAIRNHLPVAECTHFGQHRTAQALYDAVVARNSSPATTALGRLLLPYLFPEFLAFATVADLVTHLRTSDAHYRATVPAEFLATNKPPMFITLYFIVSRLPDSLRSVLLVALRARPSLRGAPPPPFPPPSPLLRTSVLLRLVRSAVAARARVAGVVEVAAVVVEVAVGAVVGAAVEVVEAVVVAAVGLVAAVGALVAAVEAVEGVAEVEAVGLVVVGLDLGMEALVVVSDSSGSVEARPSRRSSSVSGWFSVGRTCGKFHTEHRCFSPLDDALRAEFGDDVERPRWTDLLRSGVAIFDLDYDAIISAMYALSFSAEGDCYRCVPPDPSIAAAAVGASASGTPPGTAPAEALHTFTLDSGASRCFFYDSTTLTPLPAPVPVRQADPSRGPVVARSSTVLPCPAVPSGSLLACVDLHVHTDGASPGYVHLSARVESVHAGYRASSGHCVCSGVRVRSGSRLLLVSPPVAPDSSVAPPPGSPLPATPSWHALLVSRLWSTQVDASPPALAYPALPSLRRGAAACRSSLLVSPDDCTPAYSPHGRIPWIRTVRLQLRERFGTDLPVLRLHFDRGGEFSSDLLRGFCRGEGILQSFTLPDSPQQNGIAERRIGLVMEVARTSMIHAAAPHFLWPFAVRYAAHQLNLWPHVSLPETSPTLRWTGKVGDASVFRVLGSCAFVRDTSADKRSGRAIPCVFLGFVPNAPGWQFYHPTSRRVLPSQDVSFNESVPFNHPLPGTAHVQVAVGSGAAPDAASGGAASGGAEPGGAGSEGAGSGGAEPGGAEPRVAEPEGVGPGGADSEGAKSGGVAPRGDGDTGAGGAADTTGAGGTGGAAATDPGGARTSAGAGGAGAGGAGVGGPCAGGAGAAGAGVGGTGVGGTGAAGARAVDPGAGGATGTVRPRPYFVPLLQQVLGVPSSTGLPPPFLCPPPDQSQPPLRPASPLRAPSPYTEKSGGLTERREPASCPVLHVRTVPCALHIPTPCSYAEAITGPYSSQWQAAMDAEMASWKSTGTYVNEIPPLGANIVDGMWIFRPARGDLAAPPPGLTGSFPAGTKWSLRRLVYGLHQAPREWHDTLRTTLAALGFAPSTADPSLFLRTVTSLPPFYVLVYVDDLVLATADTEALTLVKSELQKRHTCTHLGPSALRLLVLLTTAHSSVYQQSLSAPPSDESVEPSGPYPELVGWLVYLMTTSGMGLVLGGRNPVVLSGHIDASWVDDSATQRSSQGYTFSLGSGSVSWRSTCSSSVLSSICEAKIYVEAMAAQELRWLTYLLTDLGEQPRSPPRGQLRLAYVATRAKTADVFTKALPPGDHQRFATVLGLLALLFWTEGLNGEYYTLTFIDACTRYVWAINTDCRSLAF